MTDPRTWSAEEVQTFAGRASETEVKEVLDQLVANPDDASIGVLRSFLGARNDDTFAKPIPSELASRALISLGPVGIDVLKESILDPACHVRYEAVLVALLWRVGEVGKIEADRMRAGAAFCSAELPDGTQRSAARAVSDIFARALEDTRVFATVGNLAFQAGMSANLEVRGRSPSASELMGLFREASIKLSRAVLESFKAMLDEDLREEEYQRFLTENPVLLDPLAAEVVAKQKLGLEYATDYAVRRHDDRWLLVEIEKPSNRLFTKRGDFRQEFVHAFGQVLDFQSWVDNHVAYAQNHMNNIAAPRGLVVIGRRSHLSEGEQQKLRRFVDNSHRIDVHTFDDLLDRGETLYDSLHHT